MAIRFRYDAAAVAPPSNATTRKYGQSLVLQQQQQKYAGQQAGYDRLFQLGRDQNQNAFQMDRDNRINDFQMGRDDREQRAKDFADARGRLDAYAKDALSDPDLEPQLRQKIQNLIAGKMATLGGGFDAPAQQQFLDQYNSQLAAILSEIPPPKPKAPPQPNFFTDPTGNQWVESGQGKWEQVPRQEQQPKTAQEYYNHPDNRGQFRKDLDAKMRSMQDAVDLGESTQEVTPEAAWKEMQKQWEFEQKALGGQSQGVGSSMPAGQPPAAGQSPGFVYQGTPDVGSYRGSQQAAPTNNWFAAIEEQVAGSRSQVDALNAETDASLANTNAILADNQARGRAVADQYAPRTEGLRRDANVLQGRNARAESALRGELGPRSPGIDPSGPYSRDSQGKLYDGRVNRIYDISDEQAKRDQVTLDAMQADGDAYRGRRDQRDAALQNRSTNPIADPKQLKRDSAKFSADFQIYKKGGGSLSIRDYINQRAKQGTLSDDLKAQLQENYGMNLADEYVSQAVEQDLNGPRENAMAAAKSKRDAEENRKRRARGLPPIQQAPPVAAPDTTRPTRGLPGGEPDMTRPTRGLPGGPPTAPSLIRVDGPARGLPGGEPTRPTHKYVTDEHLIKQSGLPQAWKPNWSKLAEEATDFDDRAMIQQVRVLASQGHPADVMNAFYILVNPSASGEEALKAKRYLLSKGINIDEITAMRLDPTPPDRGVMRGSGIKGY